MGEVNSSQIVFGDPSVSEQVKLILHANKQAYVTENSFAGYTFEAVTYICVDGTTAHSVGDVAAYSWNEDYTVCSAGYACTKCSYVEVVETANATSNAISEENGTAHSAVFTNAAFETQTKQFRYIYNSETNTYFVWDEESLNIWRLAVAKDASTNLTLMDDITLSTVGITVDETGKPSGSNWTFVSRFRGTLDGNGYSIVNLRISDENRAYFIWVVSGATIQNLTFVNPVIYGESAYTGTLASQVMNNSSIMNCHVQGGSVTGKLSGVGGLIGTISYNGNYIYGCTNSAKVTGYANWVGGIIGSINDTGNVIAACANTGEISGNQNVGGIAGCPGDSDQLIGCYTTQGVLCGNTNATVTGCYYVASEDTDGEDGTTAVNDVNTAEVVNAMNTAIDNYNQTGRRCPYTWSLGDDGYPIVMAIE